MIHVCFCMNDRTGHYSKFVGTAMLSIFENSNAPSFPPSITIHLLHDNTLTADNRNKFSYIAERYGQIVKFYNMEELCAHKIKEIADLLPKANKMRFTFAMYYRFFIPYVLPQEIKKAIFLDADMIVNLDIAELYQIDLGEKVLGVVPNHTQRINSSSGNLNYFNSGMLLMNIPAFRSEEENLKNSLKFLAENNPDKAYDQEILNHCFEKKTLHLPVKFNRLLKWERSQNIVNTEGKIYHYSHADSARSVGLDMNDHHNRLWMSYFIKTPWFGAESIGRLYKQFQEIRKDANNSILNIATIMERKSRAFFFEPGKLEEMKRIFAIRGNEEIILAENEDSIEKLIAAMKKSAGKKVFFIITGTFLSQDFFGKKFPFKRLTSEGFVKDKDFLKGWNLLSDENGMPFNSHPLIQVL